MSISGYGYFSAHTRKAYGDPRAALYAGRLWRQLRHCHPTVVDGVSVWTENGAQQVRVIARDLFSEKLRAVVQ